MNGRMADGDWWDGADVCVAIVHRGSVVEWSPGSYAPEVQVWVPENSFSRIADAAMKLGLNLGDVSSAMNGEQIRLSPEACAQLLQGWSEVEYAIAQTPADGWAAAMKLVFQQCGEGSELLIEGP